MTVNAIGTVSNNRHSKDSDFGRPVMMPVLSMCGIGIDILADYHGVVVVPVKTVVKNVWLADDRAWDTSNTVKLGGYCP